MSSARRVGERRGETEDTRKRTRRDEVVINKLRLGHTRLTHGFILIHNYRESDHRVNSAMSVLLACIHHILNECPAIAAQWREYLPSSLQGR